MAEKYDDETVANMPPKERRSDKGLVTSHFRNELGNPIHISVKETQDKGTNAKTQKAFVFDAVKIVIKGPTSVSENTITRQEAAELLRCLRQIF
jgi:hypothetical protein